MAKEGAAGGRRGVKEGWTRSKNVGTCCCCIKIFLKRLCSASGAHCAGIPYYLLRITMDPESPHGDAGHSQIVWILPLPPLPCHVGASKNATPTPRWICLGIHNASTHFGCAEGVGICRPWAILPPPPTAGTFSLSLSIFLVSTIPAPAQKHSYGKHPLGSGEGKRNYSTAIHSKPQRSSCCHAVSKRLLYSTNRPKFRQVREAQL